MEARQVHPGRGHQPYAEFVERGLLAFPVNPVKTSTPAGEVTKDRGQTKVTGKGLFWLAERYSHLSAPAPESLALALSDAR